MDKIKGSKASGPIGIVVTVLLIGLIVYEVRGFFGVSSEAATANDRIFICSQTMKSFHVDLANLSGQSPPVYSPFSGKNTAYPAELCYWTADGNTKTDPTPVLLNAWLGNNDPTFCPDCTRLVVQNNPSPIPGKKPPLTRAQYESRQNKLK